MSKIKMWGRSFKDVLFAIGPVGFLVIAILVFAYWKIDPAPPNHFTIATGDDQSDLVKYAKDYQDILKHEGVRLDIRSSSGPLENLKLLENDAADVDAAFVQDGLGSPSTMPDIVSLGSLYYEPIWIFYRGNRVLNHLSELDGKRVAVGRAGHATQVIADRLMRLSGVDMKSTKFLNIASTESAAALKKGQVDAAIVMLPPESPVIHEMISNKDLHLMNILQAEAIGRQDASYHHLVLPRGALDLNADLPREDVNILASTSTLLVRDDLHPALAFLLLKAAQEIHGSPGIFERRGEFPSNKDDQFPLSEDAVQFYKSGGPFWQRFLPYWLAALFDRFILLVIPVMAVALPLIRAVPKLYEWRIRTRIYQRYGELKFLETQIKKNMTAKEHDHFLERLDDIEERVNKMTIPKKFAEYIYSLRGHIQFVRDRLGKISPRAT